uniref:Uncharacterized protein n=1 Tax=Panagrolaimus sp. ES5 TaxID=591445 RepID=A0AC34G8G8_9BILA
MNGVFFNNFVAKRSFLFSGDEWSNLLWARSKICIKAIDKFGNVLEGELQCPDKENVVDVIQSQKNSYGLSGYSSFKGVFLNYWRTTQSKPSTPPNKFAENENAKWYLIYDKHIVLLPKTQLRNDEYLLAEMCLVQKEFIVSNHTKIEVIC